MTNMQQTAMSPRSATSRESRWEAALQPHVDIFEVDDAYVIELEVPGVPANGVDLQVERDELRVTAVREAPQNAGALLIGERKHGTFVRSFQLGELADRENIQGKLTDGVLRIRVPKQQRALPRRIKVEG